MSIKRYFKLIDVASIDQAKDAEISDRVIPSNSQQQP